MGRFVDFDADVIASLVFQTDDDGKN